MCGSSPPVNAIRKSERCNWKVALFQPTILTTVSIQIYQRYKIIFDSLSDNSDLHSISKTGKQQIIFSKKSRR